MIGQLYINGIDAYKRYGITLQDGAASILLTPPAKKDYIGNDSRLEDGKRYFEHITPYAAENTMTLPFNLTARNEAEFLTRYSKFCAEVLSEGAFEMQYSLLPNMTFRLLYVSCTQYTALLRGMAKFSLKVIEPNPNNREV